VNDDPRDIATTDFMELVRKARDGDRDALGRVLESYRKTLKRKGFDMIRRDGRFPNWDSDLLQQTFLEASRDFRQFTGDKPHELHAWLTQLLRNNFRNMERAFRGTAKRDVRRVISLSDVPEGELERSLSFTGLLPEVALVARENADAVGEALRKLPNSYREVLQLRYWQLSTFPEIAELTDLTSEGARKICERAIQKLRLHLVDMSQDKVYR
jgi:RNA polymerase sigma-70 factor (ECF subfamily)